jgi:hypothetical protein
MKTNPFTNMAAGFAALAITPAFAIEAPADESPPPPAAEAPAPGAGEKAPAPAAAKPEAKVESAFLGVVSSEVPEMLAEHLGLKPGEGILVRALMPDGPAAKAGVAVHDILTRVADQPVGSPLDLTKQVKARKPGETIHLDLIHKGKPAGIDVTLGTRPDAVAAADPLPLDELKLEGIPKDLADRVRGMIEGNVGGLGLEMKFGEGGLEMAPQPQMEEAMREMKKRMEKAMEGLNNGQAIPGMPGIDVQQGATIRMMDNDGSIELKSNDGGKEVTIRDKDNKVTWNGPWDTEQDKAAAPDDVRQRVERLNLDSKFQGNGLRLQMRPQIQPDDDGGK